MGSIQVIIYDQRGVYPTGTYHRDSNLRLISDPFNLFLKIQLQER